MIGNDSFINDDEYRHYVSIGITNNSCAVVHTHWDTTVEESHSFSSTDEGAFVNVARICSSYLVNPYGDILKMNKNGAKYSEPFTIMSLRKM